MGSNVWLKDVAAIVIAVSLGCLACGKGGGPTGIGDGFGKGGTGDAKPNAWLGGSWLGTYQLKNDDPETTSLTAKFAPVEERSGNFSLTLPERDGAIVTGQYQDFAGTSLLLKIGDSSVSNIGNKGSTTTIDYDLIGNALKITNERVLIRLVRENTGGGGGGGGTTEIPTPDGVFGHWNCADENGYMWRFNFKSETDFAVDIYNTSTETASMWMEGGMTKPDDGSFDKELLVKKSQVEKYIGLKLGATRDSKESLTVTRLDNSVAMACKAA